MNLSYLDWTIIVVYFVASLAIGLYYSRRAGKDTAEFFGAGRSLPWWLAGTSMVATTFSSDTPLAVTELVYGKGVAGNWLWWNMVFSGILTVFFYARLWRRVGVLTDLEFTELRYGGKPAAFLRGFRALYLGGLINAVIMGWVISAMATILEVSLGVNRWAAIGFCLVITLLYAGLSGLWGVVVTDAFQFVVAMIGSVAVAIYGVSAVGGVAAIKERLVERAGSTAGMESFLSMLPPVGGAWLPLTLFLTYIGVQWWASWYPGAEPGGGGYVAQRMFSAKDEKHSLLATLWFNVAHYGIRPWPWILTALVAVVVFPKLEPAANGYAIKAPAAEARVIHQLGDRTWTAAETDQGYLLTARSAAAPDAAERTILINEPRKLYVAMMLVYLPAGMLGLMLSAMAAAFMSTISTHINWGSSYLVRDFYQRFMKTDASESHYINVSRGLSVFIMAAGAGVGYMMQSQTGGWELLLTIGAGTGLVFILRWFWWRINAWSEISAMISALVCSMGLRALEWIAPELPLFTSANAFAYQLLIIVALTTVVWVTVTFLTPPETAETLDNFYRRARPGGPGWKPVTGRLGDEGKSPDNLIMSFFDWLAGCALIYAALFGVGEIIMGRLGFGLGVLGLGAAAAGFIYWDLSRRGWKSIAD